MKANNSGNAEKFLEMYIESFKHIFSLKYFKLVILPVYDGTFFFFQASLLIRISYGHVTKMSRDDGLLSELTTDVNGKWEWSVVQESDDY